MPVFFQHPVNDHTRLGIWKIEESDEFFKGNVPLHRDVTHPHKRLQHLAGRFLLQFLFPDFPYELIRIADTRKPFLKDEQYHFSISHCGDYAAAIVSKDKRVGIDIEIPSSKVDRIRHKFLSEEDRVLVGSRQPSVVSGTLEIGKYLKESIHNSRLTADDSRLPTLLWSAKESVFKWYGDGGVDFREDIHLLKLHEGTGTIDCFFTKTQQQLFIHYRFFDHLVLSWVNS